MTLSTAEGNELADKIEAWLGGVRSEPSPELGRFIDDLRTAQNINAWAGADYERMLPMVYRKSALVWFLSLFRNVLIFGPLLFTWFAVRTAASEFNRLAGAAAPGDQVSFLLVWQNLSGFHRLSTVALIGVAIFFVMILLTFAIGLLERNGTQAKRAEMRHQDLMVALERALNGYRYLSLADMQMLAKGTLQDLKLATQQVGTAADALANSSANAHSAMHEVQQVTASTFAPMVGHLATAIHSLGEAADAHRGMADLVNDARGQLAAQLLSADTSLSAVVQRVDRTAQAMLDNLETRLVGASEAIASSATSASQTINTQTVSMQNGFAEVLQRVEAAAQQMTHSVEKRLAEAVNDLASTARHVAVELSKSTAEQLNGVGATVSNAVQALERSFGDVAQSVEGASDTLKHHVNQLDYQFQQILKDLENINLTGRQKDR